MFGVPEKGGGGVGKVTVDNPASSCVLSREVAPKNAQSYHNLDSPVSFASHRVDGGSYLRGNRVNRNQHWHIPSLPLLFIHQIQP